MADIEIQRLAREYAEQHPPQTEDEVLRQYGIYLNATEVFEPFLRWLLRTHCIADKEKAKAFYNGDTFGELDFIEMVSCRRILESLFGKENLCQP